MEGPKKRQVSVISEFLTQGPSALRTEQPTGSSCICCQRSQEEACQVPCSSCRPRLRLEVSWGFLEQSSGGKTHSGPKHQKLRVYTTLWCFLQVKKITFSLFPKGKSTGQHWAKIPHSCSQSTAYSPSRWALTGVKATSWISGQKINCWRYTQTCSTS